MRDAAALHLGGGSGLHSLSQGCLGRLASARHHHLDRSVVPTYLHLFHRLRDWVLGRRRVGCVIPVVLLLEVVLPGYQGRALAAIADLLDGPLILLMLPLQCLLFTPDRGLPLDRAQARLRGLHGGAHRPLRGHARGLIPRPAGRG